MLRQAQHDNDTGCHAELAEALPKGWFDKLTMTWTTGVTLSLPKGDK